MSCFTRLTKQPNSSKGTKLVIWTGELNTLAYIPLKILGNTSKISNDVKIRNYLIKLRPKEVRNGMASYWAIIASLLRRCKKLLHVLISQQNSAS